MDAICGSGLLSDCRQLVFLDGCARSPNRSELVWLLVFAGSDLVSRGQWAPAVQTFQLLQFTVGHYFGWFVSDALFLKARQGNSHKLFALAIMIGLAAAMTSGLWQPDDWLSRLYLMACVGLFALAQAWSALQRTLSAKFLLIAGFASYPLYLLHNELGVGLLAWLGQVFPEKLWPLLPVIMAVLMLGTAYMVARYVEPRLKQVFHSALT